MQNDAFCEFEFNRLYGKSLSCLNFKLQFSSSSPRLYSRMVRVILQSSQSHQGTLTLTLKIGVDIFLAYLSLFVSTELVVFLVFVQADLLSLSFGIIGGFAGFINRNVVVILTHISFNTYFLRSLDSSLLFRYYVNYDVTRNLTR